MASAVVDALDGGDAGEIGDGADDDFGVGDAAQGLGVGGGGEGGEDERGGEEARASAPSAR